MKNQNQTQTKFKSSKPLSKKQVNEIELSQEVKLLRTVVYQNKINKESDQFNCMYEMFFNKDISEFDQFYSGLQIGINAIPYHKLHFIGSLN
ncbi:MAG: hypothetical protein IPO16_15105 [Saprospiraceae bacterium]|nr:hypothetical protein [Saprospiraceae bacterium]